MRDGMSHSMRIYSHYCQNSSKGESAGVSQLHLDQAEAALVLARQNLAEAIADYRDQLERFKVAMGLSVRAGGPGPGDCGVVRQGVRSGPELARATRP